MKMAPSEKTSARSTFVQLRLSFLYSASIFPQPSIYVKMASSEKISLRSTLVQRRLSLSILHPFSLSRHFCCRGIGKNAIKTKKYCINHAILFAFMFRVFLTFPIRKSRLRTVPPALNVRRTSGKPFPERLPSGGRRPLPWRSLC